MVESSKKDQSEMPTLYIPHGAGPCFFMDWKMGPPDTWDGMAAWLKQLSGTMPQTPKAMVVISAHWEESEITINTAAKPELLYDYYGFPKETYEIKYAAPGSPQLASRVSELLAEADIPCSTNSERGLDHGVFVPLKLVYPGADIPIVQISLKSGLDPLSHLQLGRALTPLRHEGILIVGSGMSYHNLNRFFDGDPTGEGLAFDNWLNTAVCRSTPGDREKDLSAWSDAPSARAAHPREEHLIPLMVVAGAANQSVGKRIFSQRIMNLPISGFQFG